jgi:hypothetical protein
VGRESQLGVNAVGDAKLVIVRRGHFATYELLTRAFAGDAKVQIIWDRRVGERRRTLRMPDDERRRTDRRRMHPTKWGHLDYMVAPDAATSTT